jgi:hypothetical protein
MNAHLDRSPAKPFSFAGDVRWLIAALRRSAGCHLSCCFGLPGEAELGLHGQTVPALQRLVTTYDKLVPKR